MTGPEPLTFADAAQQLSNVLGRPIRYVDVSPEQARTGMLAAGMREWYLEDMLEFYAFYATGAGASVSDVVPRIVGQPGRRFRSVNRGSSRCVRRQRIAGPAVIAVSMPEAAKACSSLARVRSGSGPAREEGDPSKRTYVHDRYG